MRSPYGMPRNPLRGDLVSGGSSSGSAVAVARGIVPLALGTDTAGSGRVPAALNNIVGLKPSLGLVSTSGVVPACRSLDCVSIFTLTVEDAFATLDAIAGHDAHDPYSRRLHSGSLGGIPARLRLGVPRSQDKLFFGDKYAELGFAEAEKFARDLGATLVEIDLTPFFETARLLYEGAWVAERTAAVGEFIAKHPDKVHPVTRDIISRGEGKSAVEAFRGLYRLQELRAKAHAAFSELDALMVPTMPRPVTVRELEADPIGPNSQFGTYTNFVNLLDFAGIAVPVTLASDGTPFGVTLLGHAGRDATLASIGMAMHARSGLTLGALGTPQPPLPTFASGLRPGEVALAVVGAHMSGMQLNGELVAPWSPSAGSNVHRARLSLVRTRRHALQARPLARCCGSGKEDRVGDLGILRGRLRRVRCVGAFSTLDRNDQASRRQLSEGLPGRSGKYCGSPRYLRVRRMARLSRSGRTIAGIGVVDRADMGSHDAGCPGVITSQNSCDDMRMLLM